MYINERKAECIVFNQIKCDLKSLNNQKMKCVDDFFYQRSWIKSCKMI